MTFHLTFSEYISVDNSQTKSWVWRLFLKCEFKDFLFAEYFDFVRILLLTILDLGFKIPPQTDVLSFRNKNARQ